MTILTFIKTNIFWIIFGVLSMMFLFVLIKMIAPIRRQIKRRKNFQPRFEKPQLKEEMPELEETEFENVKPRVVENEIAEIMEPTDYDIPAIPNPAKIQKKEIITFPKRIVSYNEAKDTDRKKLNEEIKKLKTEIREKEKENNKKINEADAEKELAKKLKPKPATEIKAVKKTEKIAKKTKKAVKKITVKKTKKAVGKRKKK
jgi:hypothetical protein